MQELRTPPFSLEAEEAVLACCLAHPDAVGKAIDIIDSFDFYRESYRHVFATICSLYNEGKDIDTITVSADLAKQGLLEEVGGRALLRTLVDVDGFAGNIENYARIVAERAAMRSLVEVGHQIAELGYEGLEDAVRLQEEAEALLFNARRSSSSDEGAELAELLAAEAKRIEDAARGVKTTGFTTCFSSIDEIIGGMLPGNLIILAARPSVGKTALAVNIAQRLAAQGSILFFSLEMGRAEITERIVAAESRVSLTRRRAGALNQEELGKCMKALDRMSKLDLRIEDPSAMTLLGLRSRIRRLATRKHPSLVVIDYLQLMTAGEGRTESRNYEISQITRGLKAMAKEFQIPVLCLSQLSRPPRELVTVPRPKLSDLRDSGCIEQDADIVMFLHRNEKKDEPVDLSRVELIVGKNRNGPIGETTLHYDAAITRFGDLYN